MRIAASRSGGTGLARAARGARSGAGALLRLCLIAAMTTIPVTLAGCDSIIAASQRSARPDVPLPYRTRLGREADRRDIVVTVEARGAGVEEVRESVRFEATRYCLETVGSSDAVWTIDPATGDWLAEPQGDRLAFRARCTGGA